MKLDVYVHNRLVGELEQVDPVRFVFSYAPGTPPDLAVSLSMPVRTESWVHRFLHPVFQVSLPEGALRDMLRRKFAKHVQHFGDVELLSTVGSHLIGRVKVTPHGAPLRPDAPEENLRELLSESSQELVDHYLGEHIQYSGVSGGFPKFLAHSPIEGEGNKSTLTFDHWIIKLNDKDHPELVLNEFFGLELARRMGLSVPVFQLSDDAERIAIRRFDIAEDGRHLGFEDTCALLGMNASDKFSGTIERVIKTFNSFCSPVNAQASRDQFYAQYLACNAIRNGDAHLKNFGLLYTSMEDARISPVYDMVSMSAYAPRSQNGDALDKTSMSLAGSHNWLTPKTTLALGKICMISAQRQKEWSESLVGAMRDTGKDILQMAVDRPEFRPMGKRMLELWSHGVHNHSETLSQDLLQHAASIQADEPVYKPGPRQRF